MRPNALAFFILSLLPFFSGCSSDSKTITPVKQDITLSVYASARVLPLNHYTAYSQSAAVIESIRVNAGDLVKKGDTLVILQSRKQKLEKDNAELSRSLARQNLAGNNSEIAQLQNELNALNIQFTVDSANYHRQLRLWKNNIGSKSQLESRELAYVNTKSRLETTQKRLEQARVTLTNRYQQSVNTAELLEVNIDDFTITSKLSNARVYDVYKEEGELVLPQEPLLMVGARNEFKIELEVDEVDITQVKVGQKVVLSLDAFPDSTFQCAITRIEPHKNERTQTFTVLADFMDHPTKLFSGISGEANIIVGSKKNVLTVPTEYITPDNKVITPDGEIAITIGERNLSRVEILSGIDAETKLIMPE